MANRINLDNQDEFRRYDPEDMLKHIRSFPDLCHQAWQMALSFQLPDDFRRINRVVILGMGGSAIGGDLVSSLGIQESRAPILVCRDYNLPRYVDENTLVIASSYSGNTEETLSAFGQALKTPARKVAVTSGGALASLCEREGIPLLTFSYRTQPRAALPFSFFIILGILQNCGLLTEKSSQVQETVEVLKRLNSRINENVPESVNPAKSLARKLVGRLAVIYGAGITAEAAHRWKTQINENSKAMAFFESFPELNHNSVVGYELPEELTRQTMVIILSSNLLPERIRRRIEITCTLLERSGIYYQLQSAEGESPLSQMMSLVLLGDYVSYYLGILNQVDPTPVQAIDYLKRSLASGDNPGQAPSRR